MKVKSYRKIRRGEPMFEMVQANQRAGNWVCDSSDHNESWGCSNPKCFKYKEKVNVNTNQTNR